jgi:DNA polymerase
LGGDMKLNMQNLPRKSPLRRALIAPAGKLVLSIDLSQIEARIVAWLCEQLDLLEAFANGEDIYSQFASSVFNAPVSRSVNPDMRFIGKTAILGLGYGMSWRKFLLSLKSLSRSQLGRVIELKDGEAQKIVNFYRGTYPYIPATWRTLDGQGLMTLHQGGSFGFGPCVFHKYEIELPGGLKLYYQGLGQRQIEDKLSWTFKYGNAIKFLYGAKVLENVTQTLARMLIMDVAIRAKATVGRFAHQVHDELIYIVRKADAHQVRDELLWLATHPPEWAAGLPVAAEVKTGPSYGNLQS